MKKLLITILSLLTAISLSLFTSGCFESTPENNTSEQQDSGKDAVVLSAPENAKVSENNVLTFDAVENAASYAITSNFSDYTDIGKVTSYDVSDIYGSTLGLVAVGDDVNYKTSKVVLVSLDNYTTLFTDFESAEDKDDWSGSVLGYSQIEGISESQAHSGEKSLKVFATNNGPYFGGILFDTGFYAGGENIDFANVKEISWWTYIDTASAEEISGLSEKYSSTYNDEITSIEEVYVEAGGVLSVFYENEDGECEKAFDKFYANKVRTNEWYKTTVNVEEYASVTDIMLRYENNARSFYFDNGPGQWAVTSPYTYIVYWDDIEVTYNPIQLETPDEITYENGKLTWSEVDGAYAYEITFDNATWQTVYETSFAVDAETANYFGVRAINGRKYANGESRYQRGAIKYYNTEYGLKFVPAVYDLSEKTIKSENIVGNLVSIVTTDDEEVEGTLENGVITVTSDLAVESGNSIDLIVVTDEGVFGLCATAYDMVVSDAAELQTMINELEASGENRKSYLFDADIDASEVITVAPAGAFYGLIDGNGHVISNLVANGKAVIDDLCGTVKNIAFVNAEAKSNSFLGYGMYDGVLENVYIDVTINVSSVAWYGAEGRLMSASTVNNCVFKLTAPNATGNYTSYGGVGACLHNSTAEEPLKNVYLIKDNCADAVPYLGTKNNANPEADLTAYTNVNGYANVNAFIVGATFNAEDGWAEYWKIEDNKLYFNNVELCEYQIDYMMTSYDLSAKTTDASNVTGTVTAIEIGGEAVEGTIENGILTITSDIAVESGNRFDVVITTDEGIFGLRATAYDMVVSDAEELQVMINELQASGTNRKNYALDADINAIEVTTGAPAGAFYGVINGNGHVISNLVANGKAIIDDFCGTVKNIAFVNAEAKSNAFLGYGVYQGTFENVYIDVTINVSNVSWYGPYGRLMSTSTINNCVFKLTAPDATGNYTSYGGVAACLHNSTAEEPLKNVYLIKDNCTDAVPYLGTKDSSNPEADLTAYTNVNGYANVNAFIVGATFNAEDGWAEYWKIEDNKLYFNGTIIIEQ